MIASDFPAKWLWQMNQHFHEVKMFLCTQAMDEARHLEVFRKRALANGGGLMRCLTGTEEFLRTILHAPTYVQGSFLMHITSGRQDLFRDMLVQERLCSANARVRMETLPHRILMQGVVVGE